MILPNGALVAVLDGTSLTLLRNKGAETQLRLVPEAGDPVEPGNPGSGGRHRNSASNPDPDRREEDSFVAGAAQRLNQMATAGTYSGLFLIADARSLGEMRKRLAPAALKTILGELDRDFAGRPVAEIEAAIRDAR